MKEKRFIVAMTGASGALYGLCLLEELLRQKYPVHLLVTEAGWRILQAEQGWDDVQQREQSFAKRFAHLPGRLIFHPLRDIGATIASGSFRCDAMIVIPCSMGSMARIAQGISSNLLERAADVMIKEERQLILVPRETPLNSIHLENMLKLSRLGVSIVPAMPAFYHQPKTVEDLIRFVVGKVLDLLQVQHDLYHRWEGHR
jgi:flavin prenyltransferase